MTTQLEKDLWATAKGREEGFPLIFRFRQHVPIGAEMSSFPTLVNIYWRYDGSNSNGMPPREDHERQVMFEDAIAPLDETEQLGYLMLVVTGNSRKEWIFYVKSTLEWIERFNELLATHAEYPIEIEINQDPEWRTWKGVASCAQH